MDSLIHRLKIKHSVVAAAKLFPPADLAKVEQTEAKLGFCLPFLLRDLLTHVANGGFGPGYGILGVEGGAQDDDKSFLGAYYFLSQDPHPDEPLWIWPNRLVPLCHWGCAIYACLDCTREEAPIVVFDPNGLASYSGQSWGSCFRPHRPSLQNWLEAWLDGVDLWKELYPE